MVINSLFSLRIHYCFSNNNSNQIATVDANVVNSSQEEYWLPQHMFDIFRALEYPKKLIKHESNTKDIASIHAYEDQQLLHCTFFRSVSSTPFFKYRNEPYNKKIPEIKSLNFPLLYVVAKVLNNHSIKYILKNKKSKKQNVFLNKLLKL